MFCCRFLVVVGFFCTNIVGAFIVKEELEQHFSERGAMAGFSKRNKDLITYHCRAFSPKVVESLLKAFAHGGHMEGFFEQEKVSIFGYARQTNEAIMNSLISMFSPVGCMHTSRKHVKMQLFSYFENIPAKDGIDFLQKMCLAIKCGVEPDAIRGLLSSIAVISCVDARPADSLSHRKVTPEKESQLLILRKNRLIAFSLGWKNWEKFHISNKDSSLVPFLSVGQYIAFFTSFMYEKASAPSEWIIPVNVIAAVYRAFKDVKDFEGFVTWLNLNNRYKRKEAKRYLSDYTVKGKKIVWEYLQHFERLKLREDALVRVLRAESHLVDDKNSLKLELKIMLMKENANARIEEFKSLSRRDSVGTIIDDYSSDDSSVACDDGRDAATDHVPDSFDPFARPASPAPFQGIIVSTVLSN